MVALLGLLVCPLTAGAEDGYGNYLNVSFSGDGTTPTMLERYEQSRPSVSAAPFSELDASGAVTYGVPLELPPALLQPDLSLRYHSGKGDHSWVARGWSIDSGLTVRRARGGAVSLARSLGHPGVDEVLEVTGGGVSGRFLRHQGDYIWQSDTPSLASVGVISTAYGRMHIHVDGVEWTVQHPENIDLGLDAGGESHLWVPVHAEDTSGNAIDWEWSGSRLDAIRFGGNDDLGLPHLIEVYLEYSPLLAASRSFDASAGFLEVIDERLARVTVHTRDGILAAFQSRRSYELRYEIDEQTLLKRVYGWDPELQQERPMASFSYTQAPSTAFQHVAWDGDTDREGLPEHIAAGHSTPVPEGSYNEYGRKSSTINAGLFDMTADGIPDLFFADCRGSGDCAPSTRRITPGIKDSLHGQSWSTQEGPELELEWLGAHDYWLMESMSTVESDTQNGVIGASRSGSYELGGLHDIDGDGYLDRISTRADDPLSYFPANGQQGTWEWAVCYGGPFGTTDCPVDAHGNHSVPAPFGYARIGSAPNLGSWSNPSQSYTVIDDIQAGQDIWYDYDDGSVDLFDMNADGLLDVVEWNDGYVRWFEKLPGRGSGWASTAVWDVDGYNPPAGVTIDGFRTVNARLDVATVNHDANTMTSPVIDETYLESSVLDLNGDGVVDRVEVVPGQGVWDVWLGDGHGFAEVPIGWAAPADVILKTYEPRPVVIVGPSPTGVGPSTLPAEPIEMDDIWELPLGWGDGAGLACAFLYDGGIYATVQDCEDAFDQYYSIEGMLQNGYEVMEPEHIDPNNPPDYGAEYTSNAGSAGIVTMGLVDMDGDGRQDYFDGEVTYDPGDGSTAVGLWFRNTGDGFETSGREMPVGLPSCEIDLPNGDVMDPFYCLSVTVTWLDLTGDFAIWLSSDSADPSPTGYDEIFTVRDLNGDGFPDALVGGDTSFNESDGAHYHGSVDPLTPQGLLAAVTNGTGLTTTYEYTHSTLVSPAGEGEHAASPATDHLLASITLDDPFDGNHAVRAVDYVQRVCSFGSCRGFDGVAYTDTTDRPGFRPGEPAVVQVVATRHALYDLRDNPWWAPKLVAEHTCAGEGVLEYDSLASPQAMSYCPDRGSCTSPATTTTLTLRACCSG